MSTVERNWIGEALAIAAGQSAILPQVEHLQALAQRGEQALIQEQLAKSVIVALLIDTGQQDAGIPTSMIRDNALAGLTVTIQRAKRGDVDYHVVELQRLVTVPQTKKARVN